VKPGFTRRIELLWYKPEGLDVLLMVLLAPFTLLYFCLTALRRFAYRTGVFPVVKADVPVIVVGNITTGGTGKTPIVIWLARQLQAQGFRPGIVSRGYGGERTQDQMSVEAASLPAEVGDEPYLMYRATGFPVQVGSDRATAVQSLLARGDVDVVVSDDGLQHYRMARCVEIAVLDSARGLGNGWLLPSGPLRESRQRLATVDVVLWNGAGETAHKDIAGVAFDLVPGPAVNLKTGEHRALQLFSGQQVSALAGIGNPQRFYDLLQRFQLEPTPVVSSDHGRVDLAAVLRDGKPVLMTEKDAVKYSDTADTNCWYVPVRAAFDVADEQQLMHRICAKLKVA